MKYLKEGSIPPAIDVDQVLPKCIVPHLLTDGDLTSFGALVYCERVKNYLLSRKKEEERIHLKYEFENSGDDEDIDPNTDEPFRRRSERTRFKQGKYAASTSSATDAKRKRTTKEDEEEEEEEEVSDKVARKKPNCSLTDAQVHSIDISLAKLRDTLLDFQSDDFKSLNCHVEYAALLPVPDGGEAIGLKCLKSMQKFAEAYATAFNTCHVVTGTMENGLVGFGKGELKTTSFHLTQHAAAMLSQSESLLRTLRHAAAR